MRNYTGDPALPALYERETQLNQQVRDGRFNSVSQSEAALDELLKCREKIRQLEGKAVPAGKWGGA